MGLRNARPCGAAKCRGAYGTVGAATPLSPPAASRSLADTSESWPPQPALAQKQGVRQESKRREEAFARRMAPPGPRAGASGSSRQRRPLRTSDARTDTRTHRQEKREEGAGPVGSVWRAIAWCGTSRARAPQPSGPRTRPQPHISISDRGCAARAGARATKRKRAPAEIRAAAECERLSPPPPKTLSF